jgi:tRNA modification GTPase
MIRRDTIYALSSGWGKAAIAVVRVSGPKTKDLFSLLRSKHLQQRRAYHKTLYALDGSLIDSGLVLWFEGPRSFTGEDMLELQIHGSNASKARLLQTIGQFAGFREAEPVSD